MAVPVECFTVFECVYWYDTTDHWTAMSRKHYNDAQRRRPWLNTWIANFCVPISRARHNQLRSPNNHCVGPVKGYNLTTKSLRGSDGGGRGAGGIVAGFQPSSFVRLFHELGTTNREAVKPPYRAYRVLQFDYQKIIRRRRLRARHQRNLRQCFY